jgi:hypothetical protein
MTSLAQTLFDVGRRRLVILDQQYSHNDAKLHTPASGKVRAAMNHQTPSGILSRTTTMSN